MFLGTLLVVMAVAAVPAALLLAGRKAKLQEVRARR